MPRNLFGRARRPKASAPLGPILNVVPAGEDGSPAEVTLFGDVVREIPRDYWTGEPVQGMYISVEEVLERLEEVRDAPEIVIRLNTGGGDLFSGVTIHDLLRSFKGRKTVIVEGLAASAGSLIMCAGDTIRLHEGTMVMIHNVQSILWGWYRTEDLERLINSHHGTETACKRIYNRRCKKSDAELQRMMDEETWLVGQDAIDMGLADELVEAPIPEEGDDPSVPAGGAPMEAHLSADRNFLVVAGIPHLVAEVGSIPPWLRDDSTPDGASEAPPVAQAIGGEAAQTSEEAVMISTTAELRHEYPELVATVAAEAVEAERETIANSAVEAERQRIREIEEIAASIGDDGLVARAKYEEPMSAAELAYTAAKAGASFGTQMIAALDGDSDESDTEKVETDPNDEDTDEDADAERKANSVVNEALSFLNKSIGRQEGAATGKEVK